jgi:hypothetical protein
MSLTDEATQAQSLALLGFALSPEAIDRADTFLEMLFPGDAPAFPPEESFISVLEWVIADFLDTADPEQVILPLSGGLDSRAILGALTRTYPRERIHCVTVGEPRNAEVLGAARACATHGLKHTVIDPNTYVWDAATSVHRTRAAFRELGVYSSFGSALFDSMATATGSGAKSVFLSGFLGDAVTGSHLRYGAFDPNRDAIDAFIAHNACLASADVGFARPIFASFVERWHDRLRSAGHSGMTAYDILDLGFRQALRIRWVTTISGARAFSPFTHPALVGYWYTVGAGRREGQSLYKAELLRQYPEIFASTLPTYWQNVGKRLKGRARRLLRWPTAAQSSERGTLARNPSKRRILRQMLEGFAERKVPLPWDVHRLLAALEGSPLREIKLINATATAEINWRAGNFATPRSLERAVG